MEDVCVSDAAEVVGTWPIPLILEWMNDDIVSFINNRHNESKWISWAMWVPWVPYECHDCTQLCHEYIMCSYQDCLWWVHWIVTSFVDVINRSWVYGCIMNLMRALFHVFYIKSASRKSWGQFIECFVSWRHCKRHACMCSRGPRVTHDRIVSVMSAYIRKCVVIWPHRGCHECIFSWVLRVMTAS